MDIFANPRHKNFRFKFSMETLIASFGNRELIRNGKE